MIESSFTAVHERAPVDLLGALFRARGWKSANISGDEICAEVQGNWTKYQLRAAQYPKDNVMQFFCLPDVRIGSDKIAAFRELISLINETMWLGHFDLWSKGGVLVYRHCVMLNDMGLVGLDQVQMMVEHALADCDLYYPAFQFLLWSDRTPQEALDHALVDPVGEA